MTTEGTIRFGDVTLEPAAMRVRRGGQELALEPKSYRVLVFLVEHRARVVSKDELFRAVWEETAVTDNALTRAIAQIRKALGDDPKQPRFIETVPTVGYRFIGLVEVEEVAAAVTPVPKAAAGRRLGPRMWLGLAALVLVVCGIAGWLVARRGHGGQVVSNPVPLATYRGDQEAPSFSPDGSQVAFQWNGEDEGNLDIYAKALAADATPLRLTSDPAADRWPAWSPDGSRIAFQRAVGRGNRVELRVIPALGGPERRLAEFAINLVGSAPVWSPDGRWLVVCVWQQGRVALERVSVETGEMTSITAPANGQDDDSPAISGDGKTLLFVRRPDFYYWGELYRVQLGADLLPAGSPEEVPDGGLLLSGVAWIPETDEVLLHSAEGVSRMRAAGAANPEAVPFLGGEVGSLALSRSGHRLAYTIVHGDANIWRQDLLNGGTAAPEELIASTFRDVSPKYSPDGRWLAFQSNRTQGNRAIGRSQIWIATAAGEHARQLTATRERTSAGPVWSPDGRTVSFQSNMGGTWQTYEIGLEGGPVKQRTPGEDNLGWTWSPDQQQVYFDRKVNGRREVWRMPAAGGVETQVTREGGSTPLLSINGKFLFFVRSAAAEEFVGTIWKMALPAGPQVQVAGPVFRSNLAVTAHGLYWMTAPGAAGKSMLRYLDFRTGLTRTIAAIGHPELGLDVSPDERYLVYAQLDGEGKDLMLVEDFR